MKKSICLIALLIAFFCLPAKLVAQIEFYYRAFAVQSGHYDYETEERTYGEVQMIEMLLEFKFGSNIFVGPIKGEENDVIGLPGFYYIDEVTEITRRKRGYTGRTDAGTFEMVVDHEEKTIEVMIYREEETERAEFFIFSLHQ